MDFRKIFFQQVILKPRPTGTLLCLIGCRIRPFTAYFVAPAACSRCFFFSDEVFDFNRSYLCSGRWYFGFISINILLYLHFFRFSGQLWIFLSEMRIFKVAVRFVCDLSPSLQFFAMSKTLFNILLSASVFYHFQRNQLTANSPTSKSQKIRTF